MLLVHLAILGALLASGRVTLPGRVEEPPVETFDVLEPLPPPPNDPPAPEQAQPKEEGEASPPNLKSEAAPVVAPRPVVPLPVPTPVPAAETPGSGSEPTQGSAAVPGPGTGAGGSGTGTGAGGFGAGPGGGGLASGPRQIAGSISRRDYPRELRDSQVPVEVIRLEYVIGTDGRVRNCRIVQSSGTPLLDRHTCRLYEQRYRYQPARDSTGRPVEVTIRTTRSWFIAGRARPVGD